MKQLIETENEAIEEPSVTSWYIFKGGLNKWSIFDKLNQHPMLDYIEESKLSEDEIKAKGSLIGKLLDKLRTLVPYPLPFI